jgi:large subunit ribosomal protein L32
VTTIHCSNCHVLVKPHHVCASCGHYKGQEVVAAKE